MKRSELRADPDKVRAWQQRSRAKKPAVRRVPQAWVPAADKDRWYGSLGKRCVFPTCHAHRALKLHHIVYRQEVRRRDGDQWDPRNGLTVCERCHEGHHQRHGAIPLVLLPDAAVEFAFELLGPAAGIYLPRRYRGPASARFVALLEATA